MGRFAYIPLNYSNIDKGLAREIVLKPNTDKNPDFCDLYTMDDYKIPVSATTKIREEVNSIDENIENKIDDLDNIINDYMQLINRIRIIQQSYVVNSNRYKEEYVLSDCVNDYIENINIIKERINKNTSQIEANIDNFIKNFQISTRNLYNYYKEYTETIRAKIREYNTYISDYISMNSAINTSNTKNKVALKAKLGRLENIKGYFNVEKENKSTIVSSDDYYLETKYWYSSTTISNNNHQYYIGNSLSGNTYYFEDALPVYNKELMGMIDLNEANKISPNTGNRYYVDLGISITSPYGNTFNDLSMGWWFDIWNSIVKNNYGTFENSGSITGNYNGTTINISVVNRYWTRPTKKMRFTTTSGHTSVYGREAYYKYKISVSKTITSVSKETIKYSTD